MKEDQLGEMCGGHARFLGIPTSPFTWIWTRSNSIIYFVLAPFLLISAHRS